MFLTNLRGRALPALALGFAFVGTAAAGTQTQTFSDTVPLTTTNWDRTVALTRFDPNLGTLLSVTLKLDGRIEGQAAVESSDTAPIQILTQFKADITLARPDLSVVAIVIPQVDNVSNLAPSDGTLDFAGPSGQTFPNLQQQASQTVVSPPPPSDLVLFTGAAGNPGQIILPVTARGTSQAIGSGNVTTSFATKAAATITVTYTYNPPIVDCNGNLIDDPLDIASGFSNDCDLNGVPDECQPDCDNDGVPDVCEPDCDGDDIPNDCDDPCPQCEEAGYRTPGSLLLYPLFDNREGQVTLVTVTNTNCDTAPIGGGLQSGTVDVEFVYIGRFGMQNMDLPCLETNRTRRLTPCDTFTAWTDADNPNQEMGYLYVFAKNPTTGKAIVWNHLIGEEIVLGSTAGMKDSLSAVPFKGIGAQGAATDVDLDNIRDLDGVEYSKAPEEIAIPRFIGQDGIFQSRLALVGLSGGTQFTTTLNFMIYNDNEEGFSGQYTFQCWAYPYLSEMSGAFNESFLDTTTNAPLEIVGRSDRESGWLHIDGAFAQSTAAFITDPAFYAVLVERAGPYVAAALPFEICTQDNGKLLPSGPFGN